MTIHTRTWMWLIQFLMWPMLTILQGCNPKIDPCFNISSGNCPSETSETDAQYSINDPDVHYYRLLDGSSEKVTDTTTDAATGDNTTTVDGSVGDIPWNEDNTTPADGPSTDTADKAITPTDGPSADTANRTITPTDGPSADTSDGGPCSHECGTHSWACWPMPNPANDNTMPNPASYTVLGNGIVRDNITCLEWQQDVLRTASAYVWTDAQAYCSELTFAGGGWRLPTRIELTSLTDYTRTSPALPTELINTVSAAFWTITPWAVVSGATSWKIDSYDGTASSQGDRAGMYNARCVRGNGSATLPPGPPTTPYKLIGSGEILDNYTKLIWQQTDSGQGTDTAISWDEANNYCIGLSLGGHTWRLASIKELQTLVNDTDTRAPAASTDAFPEIRPVTSYWSATHYDNEPASSVGPWTISFLDGAIYSGQTAAIAKCVR